MLHAHGINPLDLIVDEPSEPCSDLDGDPESAEPSPAAEKSKKKTELLKQLKSALGVLREKNLKRPTQLEKDISSSTIQEFRNALELCLPKNSSMTSEEILSKIESDIFPRKIVMNCLTILANKGVIKWANLVVS